ncbi:TolC family protein [Bacteroidetes/Chlorobi group bacterium MS-B_bin-24]|nr:MAG: TolC family protein [Bacteroidetes/Chlorobi group bacterium MS-B_bin-24]
MKSKFLFIINKLNMFMKVINLRQLNFICFVSISLYFLLTSNIYSIDLTLEKSIKIGVENNKDLAYQKLEIEKAEQAVKEAKGHAYPTIDFNSSFYHYIQKPILFFPDFQAFINNATYGILFKEHLVPPDNSKFLPMGLTKQSFFLNNQFENKIQLTQILFNSTVFRGIGASKTYLEISKYNYQSTLCNLVANIKKAFYGCILLKNLKEIYQESLANAEENLATVKSLYNQGLISEFDLMQAEVQVENLKPLVENANNSYKNALNNLKLLLNLPMDTSIEITGELAMKETTIPEQSELIKLVSENNLQLKTLEYKKKVDIEMVELYRSEYYPSLVAFANYSFAGQSDKLNFNTYSQSLIGIQLSINLFNGFQTKSRVQQSTINYKQTEEQIQQLRQFLTKQILERVDDLEKARKQILAQEKNIRLAEKAYQIAQTKYKNGTAIQLEVKNAENELRQAKLNYQQALFEYISAQIDIDNILGKIDYEDK